MLDDDSDRPARGPPIARARRHDSDEAVPLAGHTIPHVSSAAACLEHEAADTALSGLRDLKQGLLRGQRRLTEHDLHNIPRLVTFDKRSALADLAYVAHAGVTSRIATRASLAVNLAPDAGGGGGGGIARRKSYLRLAVIDVIAANRLAEGALGSAPSARAAEPASPELHEHCYVDEEAGLTRALLRTAGVALLSAVQFGYNNGCMNTQAGVQRAALGIPVGAGVGADTAWSTCVSVFCAGALLGCNASGSLADAWGRRRFLLASAGVYTLGAAAQAACALPRCCAPAPAGPCWARLALLCAGRALSGAASGGSTVVVPMYLGEVAPAHLRGTLGTAFQLTFVSAMFVAQLLGLPAALGTPRLWPLVLGAVALPGLLQLALGGALVESPRWHCLRGEVDAAVGTLTLLRDAAPDDEVVLEELDAMLLAADAEGGRPFGSPPEPPPKTPELGGWRGFGAQRQPERRGGRAAARGGARLGRLLRPPTAYPLAICMALMVLQQLSGINNAFNYSATFLHASGFSEATITAIAVLMNGGNVGVTALSVYLMDRAGRRALLVTSAAAMAAAGAALTLALVGAAGGARWAAPLLISSMVAFVAAFGVGLGPVPWLLPSELMPAETRALAASVAASANWLANLLVGQLFLGVADALGPYAFAPFALVCAATAALGAWCVPETKGKSLEQIQRELRAPRGRPASSYS